jgi:AcrR family transcriptional regulator
MTNKLPPTESPGDSPLLEGILPYDAFRDKEGSETLQARVPGRVIRMVDDLLALRKVPQRNRSELLRAALFHFLKHAADLSENPDLVLEWLAIEEASRMARWELERTKDTKLIEDIATSLRHVMEAGVKEGPEVKEILERFFQPIVRLDKENRHRRALLRLAGDHPNLWRAIQDNRADSPTIQQVYEEIAVKG